MYRHDEALGRESGEIIVSPSIPVQLVSLASERQVEPTGALISNFCYPLSLLIVHHYP